MHCGDARAPLAAGGLGKAVAAYAEQLPMVPGFYSP